MTSIPPPVDRALAVLSTNEYMTLATCDSDGPWAAGIAHVVAPPSEILFFSYSDSRHVKAIRADERVAGAIFDSRAATEDVESIQFAGRAVIEEDPNWIRTLFERIAAKTGEPVDEEAIERHIGLAEPVLVRVTVSDAYVLDQHQYEDSGRDGREPVDLKLMFSRFFGS